MLAFIIIWLLGRDKQSFEFAVNRCLMKIFKTSNIEVIEDCERYFGILPVRLQIDIRTAKFLCKFAASNNSVCDIFKNTANAQASSIFEKYSPKVKTPHEFSLSMHNS